MPSYRSQREQRTAAVSAAMHVGAAVSVVGKRPAAPENLNWAAVGRLANAGVHLGNPVHETPVVAVASVVADDVADAETFVAGASGAAVAASSAAAAAASVAEVPVFEPRLGIGFQQAVADLDLDLAPALESVLVVAGSLY